MSIKQSKVIITLPTPNNQFLAHQIEQEKSIIESKIKHVFINNELPVMINIIDQKDNSFMLTPRIEIFLSTNVRWNDLSETVLALFLQESFDCVFDFFIGEKNFLEYIASFYRTFGSPKNVTFLIDCIIESTSSGLYVGKFNFPTTNPNIEFIPNMGIIHNGKSKEILHFINEQERQKYNNLGIDYQNYFNYQNNFIDIKIQTKPIESGTYFSQAPIQQPQQIIERRDGGRQTL